MAWVVATCPITLTSSWRRRSSSASTSSGPGKPTPGVVDQPIQPAAGKAARDLVDGRVDRGGQRDVEDDDAQAPRRAGEGGRVRGVLDARENVDGRRRRGAARSPPRFRWRRR